MRGRFILINYCSLALRKRLILGVFWNRRPLASIITPGVDGQIIEAGGVTNSRNRPTSTPTRQMGLRASNINTVSTRAHNIHICQHAHLCFVPVSAIGVSEASPEGGVKEILTSEAAIFCVSPLAFLDGVGFQSGGWIY